MKCVVCGKEFSRLNFKRRKTCSDECYEVLRRMIAEKYHLRFNDRLSWNKTKVNYPIEKKYSDEAQRLIKEWGLPER